MKWLKEVTRIKDSFHIRGGLFTHSRGGLVSKDGGPVDPELIAKAFKVPLEEAREISRRMSL